MNEEFKNNHLKPKFINSSHNSIMERCSITNPIPKGNDNIIRKALQFTLKNIIKIMLYFYLNCYFQQIKLIILEIIVLVNVVDYV